MTKRRIRIGDAVRVVKPNRFESGKVYPVADMYNINWGVDGVWPVRGFRLRMVVLAVEELGKPGFYYPHFSEDEVELCS